MSEDLKFALTNLFQMALVFLIVSILLMMGLLANQAGWFGPPTEQGSNHGNSRFMIEVAANGESVFGAFENVSEVVRREVRDKVYPTPEAATHAVSEPLAGNPAHAHAVKLCTHSRLGVQSQFTGAGRHLTWFLKHQNGLHYTRTVHQVLNQNGWLTVATYDYAVSRGYCGCR